MRALGGPWSPVGPDSTWEEWRVVDGLRGPLRGPGPLPAGVRVVEYGP